MTPEDNESMNRRKRGISLLRQARFERHERGLVRPVLERIGRRGHHHAATAAAATTAAATTRPAIAGGLERRTLVLQQLDQRLEALFCVVILEFFLLRESLDLLFDPGTLGVGQVHDQLLVHQRVKFLDEVGELDLERLGSLAATPATPA